MSGDLTRWNRAGLSRFRYVDGNAILWLERLRAALADAYRDPETGSPVWRELETRHPAPAGETAAQRRERLTAQYHDERRDFGWEILRAYARSTHVLTEHLDAYANEGFIRTATQWDNLRRLVEMLDYHPAPPASAGAPLAFTAKAPGVLAAGFQVKNVPKDDAPPAIFETIADLAVDPALNALRLADWDRSQENFTYAPTESAFQAVFPLAAGAEPPSVGAVGVLVIAPADATGHEAGYAVQVTAASGDALTLRGQATATGAALTVKRWQVRLLLEPEKVAAPKLAGPDVVILTPGHNLVAGRSKVTWGEGSVWRTASAAAIEDDRVRLSGSHIAAVGKDLYLLALTTRTFVDESNRAVLPTSRGAGGRVWRSDLTEFGAGEILQQNVRDGTGVLYNYVTTATAFFVPSGSDPVAEVLVSGPTDTRLAGDPGDIAAGHWVARTDAGGGGGYAAARVESVTEGEDDYALDLSPAPAGGGALHMLFRRTLRPRDHDRNLEPAFDASIPSDTVTRVPIAAKSWTDALVRGRVVIALAEDEDGTTHAHLATIKAVDVAARTVDVAPAIPGAEATGPGTVVHFRWNTTILANVADATHGETKPARALGNGDATQTCQEFPLSVERLSFIRDSAMPAGVRAAIEIEVAGQVWAQVGNLRASGPTDAHYEVRMTEAGTPILRFGDGERGRRLPTGTNNVRVTYRKGVGAAGNLAAESLVKIVRPSPLISAARQPIAAAGGAEMEPAASLRENAPASVLTLDRAVSLEDFARLAATNSSVLQAHAYRAPADVGRAAKVSVVVVPAGGEMGTLGPEIQAFLRARALPGVAVAVEPFEPLPLQLDVTVRVDVTAYDPDEVTASTRAAFVAAYDLEHARLGAPLYRSQLLYVAERVKGVENAVVEIRPTTWVGASRPPTVTKNRTQGFRSVRPHPNQMLLVDPDLSVIAVRAEAFSL